MRNYSARPRDAGRAVRPVPAMTAPCRDAWFADEVAIDFPSLRAVFERMHAAFIAASTDGDGRGRRAAELHLSLREAFDGATVPLEVPVWTLCLACGGRGEVWSDRCGLCDGLGEALSSHAIRLIVPPRVRDGDRFSLSVSAPSALPTRIDVRVVLR